MLMFNQAVLSRQGFLTYMRGMHICIGCTVGWLCGHQRHRSSYTNSAYSTANGWMDCAVCDVNWHQGFMKDIDPKFLSTGGIQPGSCRSSLFLHHMLGCGE